MLNIIVCNVPKDYMKLQPLFFFLSVTCGFDTSPLKKFKSNIMKFWGNSEGVTLQWFYVEVLLIYEGIHITTLSALAEEAAFRFSKLL